MRPRWLAAGLAVCGGEALPCRRVLREGASDAGSLSRGGKKFDLPTVQFDEAFDKGEAEARARLFDGRLATALEGIEDAAGILFRNPLSGVRDPDRDGAIAAARTQRDRPPPDR